MMSDRLMPIKRSPKDLAIMGGPKAFPSLLHVGAPNIGCVSTFQSRLNSILQQRWLTNDGRYLKRFESAITEKLGVKHCIAVANGTIAIEILIRALGLTGEVILPSFTFVATAHAMEWMGLRPVFCDIESSSANIDANQIERLITPETSAVMGVHVWGHPCDIDVLEAVAKRHGLKLIFDAAHAFGCTYKGRMVGGFGNAEILSFHATKVVNSLEGGAILTNDSELAAQLRLMRNFGFTDYGETACVGTNGKMNEVSAAMGLTNLESMDAFVGVNEANYEAYRDELAGIRGVSLVPYASDEEHNYGYIVVEVDETAGLPRDLFVRMLHSEGVLVRRYFHPGCHRLEPYMSRRQAKDAEMSRTETLSERVVCLPNGTAVGRRDVSAICSIIKAGIEASGALVQRFQADIA
jgi:dTDP-4-amino-4,6-dideoxygalactose transaminase